MGCEIDRFVAIDWSGAQSLSEQRRRIVVADWHQGKISLSAGRTRTETATWLIEQAARTPAMVVGLDFSFSFPAWFVRQCGASTGATAIEDFWRFSALHAEEWLADCPPPFWGRPAKQCPEDHRGPAWRGYRQCEQRVLASSALKSTFQIGGAGAVGTGSLRGIATLLALRAAGFSIWPFHNPALPCAIEIYPRLFTGPVRKSSETERTAYLQKIDTLRVPDDALDLARSSEDAFDALCSVVGMAAQCASLARLEQAKEATTLLEGDIFPGSPIREATVARARPRQGSRKQGPPR